MPTGTMIGRPNISTDHDEPMDEEHRKILKSVREVLVQDMDPEEVLLAMSGSHLLSERDEEKIKAKDLTRHQKCEMLLDTIPKRGAKAYDIFKEAIEKAHSHLISTILKAENSVLRSELSMERENSADLRERLSSTGTFLPSDEDFQKPGVICSLKKEKSSEVVATRSSDGPGNANDVVNHQTYKLVKGKTRSCGTAEKQDSWWCVDLGKDYLLFLTHYALRHGKKEGDSILCRRKLQGSIDGKDWKDIKTKNSSNQPMHSGPFPYYTGTWTVGGEVGAFRYFRIVQTGRNSSRKYGIYLYGIELYGVLIKA
ncbi:uncharacterized protein LOC144661540 [Oculina patagonica]